MKKLVMFLVFTLTLLVGAPGVYAQHIDKEQRKAEKAFQKEVKAMKRQGWKVAPGNLSLELQLRESYQKAAERDENGFEKYFSGEAMSVGTNYDAALFQASNLAKLDLAGKIQTEVTELIDNKVSNKQLTQKEAVSLTESVSSCQSKVSQKLGRVMTPVIIYRDLDNGNVEVRTVIYYSHDQAIEILKQTVQEDLENKEDELANQIDHVFNVLMSKYGE